MSDKRLANVLPTRMNLQALKLRRVSAQKGHSLLKKKADALSARFRRLQNQIRQEKEAMDGVMSAAHWSMTQAVYSAGDISSIVEQNVSGRATTTIQRRIDNVAGTALPSVPLMSRRERESEYTHDDARSEQEDAMISTPCVLPLPGRKMQNEIVEDGFGHRRMTMSEARPAVRLRDTHALTDLGSAGFLLVAALRTKRSAQELCTFAYETSVLTTGVQSDITSLNERTGTIGRDVCSQHGILAGYSNIGTLLHGNKPLQGGWTEMRSPGGSDKLGQTLFAKSVGRHVLLGCENGFHLYDTISGDWSHVCDRENTSDLKCVGLTLNTILCLDYPEGQYPLAGEEEKETSILTLNESFLHPSEQMGWGRLIEWDTDWRETLGLPVDETSDEKEAEYPDDD
ncbi:ATPase, V1 complex, subunit D [Kipferlia bialata]|uniref:ATPase, V1 complex, subunit D n=1 Tax=Kipferlia bialata TaxID=797122 RepID=A0A9K3CRQ0_9EUKA|nr:ATPase, V1 complex, subunit D [Kipferlia bialata]|eukprot:g2175.t1